MDNLELRVSGSGRILVRCGVKLCRSDQILIVKYKSASQTVNIGSDTGKDLK